jgi:hypothetical protein
MEEQMGTVVAILSAPTETQVIANFPIYQSQIDRVVDEILSHAWVQDEARYSDRAISPEIAKRAILNVLQQQFEAMLEDWDAEEWLRGDRGTALQQELKGLVDRQANRAA